MIETQSLAALLQATPYLSYSYSYPHKTAYRHLTPAQPLAQLWDQERRDALFLYMHVPFCEMRCGFCNLFTTTNPQVDFVGAYLDTLERQARIVREALGKAHFARFAIGGGTPTFLTVGELDRLFTIAREMYGVDLSATPISVETSPGTAEPEKMRLLHEHGVDRVSIGVQSFLESEVRAVGRAQKTVAVETALGNIRDAGIPALNVDLIYGIPEQTRATWRYSLEAALQFAPEELYLYPLYNRPLTGLDRMGKSWDDIRLPLYHEGRELLLDAGYAQVSMRMFRKVGAAETVGPVYCCQEDGMVGLGCGARSYSSALHYSSEYAVSARGVKAILSDYIGRSDEQFAVAGYGFRLDGEDQRRRYAIQSLLQIEGLSLNDYRRRFGSDPFIDLPELHELGENGLAELQDGVLRLNPAGLERSDTIGPWLYSRHARALMEEYELR